MRRLLCVSALYQKSNTLAPITTANDNHKAVPGISDPWHLCVFNFSWIFSGRSSNHWQKILSRVGSVRPIHPLDDCSAAAAGPHHERCGRLSDFPRRPLQDPALQHVRSCKQDPGNRFLLPLFSRHVLPKVQCRLYLATSFL